MKFMYYKPKDGIFFPKYKYELFISMNDESGGSCYYPEDIEKTYNELKLPHTIVEVMHGTLVNTTYMKTCEIITKVLLSNKFEKQGWVHLNGDLLHDILSDKGQTILMAENMKVETKESFKISDKIYINNTLIGKEW